MHLPFSLNLLVSVLRRFEVSPRSEYWHGTLKFKVSASSPNLVCSPLNNHVRVIILDIEDPHEFTRVLVELNLLH
jgi:hypothetical protein